MTVESAAFNGELDDQPYCTTFPYLRHLVAFRLPRITDGFPSMLPSKLVKLTPGTSLPPRS